jgi:hypothetical protein
VARGLLRLRFAGVASVVLLWTGCGESAAEPEPEPRFEIGGTYFGPVMGESEDGALEADLLMFIEHDDGELAGYYDIRGVIRFGDLFASISGGGTYVGTLFPGTRPALALTLQNSP